MGEQFTKSVDDMSTSLLAGIVWVLVSTGVALLPIRRQFAIGAFLLCVAPALLIWIAYDHGWWIAALGMLAFVSMFRNPLIYLIRRAKGERPELPK